MALQALLLAEDPRAGAAVDALDQAWLEAGVAPGAASPELARERGLALELTQGVLRWELRLDAIAARLARKGKMHKAVRQILRLGLYQLLFLDRIPRHAAVAETVALTRPAGVGFASGFVNAALRRFAADPEGLGAPEAGGIAGLAERWSHPLWLARAMDGVVPGELSAWMQANQTPPPITLRAAGGRWTPEAVLDALGEAGVGARRGAFCPDALHLEGRVGNPATLPGFAEGAFTIQDEASQVVGLLAGARPGDTVLDACAAPGGKAAHLAAQVGASGVVWAVDQSAARLALLTETVARLRLPPMPLRLSAWGAGEVSGELPILGEDEAQGVDVALVDAPCSALGILRRAPEVKRRRSPEGIREQARRQGRILDEVARRVRPGGALTYAVCSPLPEEGIEVVEAFLSAHGDFHLEDPRRDGPAPWHALLDDAGCLKTFPHRHGADAFFAARLRRE